MYPGKITRLLAPVLERFPGYRLKPVSHAFGNSQVEVDGPAEGSKPVKEAVVDALVANGFEVYPMSATSSPVGVIAHAKR